MDINTPVDTEMGSAWIVGSFTWGIITSSIAVALKLLTWSI